jgi:hypothetical protein
MQEQQQMDTNVLLREEMFMITALKEILLSEILTIPYSGRTVEDWWTTFREKNSFPHPCGEEAAFKQSTARLPPILRDNDDLQQNFVRFCTLHLTDLSIDLAREYICDTLILEFFSSSLTIHDNHQESHKERLKRLYKLDETPSHSTIWEWLTRCGFKYKQQKKRFFVDTHESLPNCKYWKEQTVRYLKRERLKH